MASYEATIEREIVQDKDVVGNYAPEMMTIIWVPDHYQHHHHHYSMRRSIVLGDGRSWN